MLNLLLNSSYDNNLPFEFSTSLTDTTPLSYHDFQNKVALSMVIDLLFPRINLPFGEMKILKNFLIKEGQTCFQEFQLHYN